MKSLTSGKLFTFKGVTYQVKRTPDNNSVRVGCLHCNKYNMHVLFGNTLCNRCANHIDYDCYPVRVYKRDDPDFGFIVKNALNIIKSVETTEVIERLKRFGSFTATGMNSEYSYIFKKPITVTIQGYHFNGYTKVKSVAYRPAFKGGPIYTVGLYSQYDEKELIGETIITDCVGRFCPGDTIRIALAIK